MKAWSKVVLGDLFNVEKGKIKIMTVTGKLLLVITGKDFASRFSGDVVCIPLISAKGHGHVSFRRVHHNKGEFDVDSILCARKA